MASTVVSVRVPEHVKRELEEAGVEYQAVVRQVLRALADAASGRARSRMLEAFALADQAAGTGSMTAEEIVEATRCGR